MRRTATLLSTALLLAGLAACGGDDGRSEAPPIETTGCERDRIATTQAIPGAGDEPTTYRVVLSDDTLRGISPVTDDGVISTDPTFSGDGRRLAYVQHAGPAEPYGNASTIWTIGPDGDDPQRITGGADWSNDPEAHTTAAGASGPWDIQPDWSPTENLIAFTHITPSAASDDAVPLQRLYTVVPGQEPALLLADPAAQGFAPAFSPDGSQIAFLRGDRTTGKVAVWLVGTDGTRPRKLADTSDASEVVWTPDGATIGVGGKSIVGEALPLRRLTVADGTSVPAAKSGAAMAWSRDGARFYAVTKAESSTAVFNDVLSILVAVDGELTVESPSNSLDLFRRPQLDGLDVTDCPS